MTTRTAALGLCLASLALCPPAAAQTCLVQDPFEPNQDCSSATAVTAPSLPLGTFNVTFYDEDWLRCTVGPREDLDLVFPFEDASSPLEVQVHDGCGNPVSWTQLQTSGESVSYANPSESAVELSVRVSIPNGNPGLCTFYGLRLQRSPILPIEPFCTGDGSGSACPCGNSSAPDSGRGCMNSTGAGALLFGAGTPSLSQDSLTMEAWGLPPATSCVLVSGRNRLSNGQGAMFADGLRCVGGDVVRHVAQQASATGIATWGWSRGNGRLLDPRTVAAGAGLHFQVFYRDDDQAICTSGVNTTNAVSVEVLP